MHIHVGSNIPGYLPDKAPGCFSDIDSAIEYLKHELRGQQEYYESNCPGPLTDDAPPCECEWCDVASDVEVALSGIADGDAAKSMREGRGSLFVFSPPQVPSAVHWAAFADSDRDLCDIAQEQGN